MKKSCAAIAYLLLIAVVLTTLGCAVENGPGTRFRVPKVSPEPIIDLGPQAIVRHSLSMIPKVITLNGCQVRFPYVCNPDMDRLNLSIQSTFMDFANASEVDGGEVGYTVEFNRYGLLSFIMTYTTADGDILFIDAADFDSDTGLRVKLPECFGSDTDFAPRVNELIEKRIGESGLTLLGRTPTVGEDTLFVFTFSGIELLYRPYEAFSYDAGTARIPITMYETSGVTAPDGLLNRLR